MFGEVSAQSRTNYEMRCNADENGDLPIGVKAVYKHFYMDDGLPSMNSREEAIEMRKQMTELLRRRGFPLRKWLTNYPEVLATIPEQDRSPRFLELSENNLPTDRALGVVWDAEEDVLKYWAPRRYWYHKEENREPSFLSLRSSRTPATVLNQK